MKEMKNTQQEWLKKELLKFVNPKSISNSNPSIDEIIKLSIKLYEKGFNGLDIINLLETPKFMESLLTQDKKYELLFAFNKVRKEFRNEKILILFILNFIFLDKEQLLENISFI